MKQFNPSGWIVTFATALCSVSTEIPKTFVQVYALLFTGADRETGADSLSAMSARLDHVASTENR
ncbi:uncharacterized protein N7482_010526 [Penicillium canariense]|uniref:Uncharacterized protein n=1 Tax=Penicillium canariense TaxID=189055 RepID=A0A9W9HPC8_9EURO|nr:uncharacterized protein N7482_010526 [Penicillium canariense]KAJ5151274.1 hypothetical protein N7482_010526 [Penicillium canariense]